MGLLGLQKVYKKQACIKATNGFRSLIFLTKLSLFQAEHVCSGCVSQTGGPSYKTSHPHHHHSLPPSSLGAAAAGTQVRRSLQDVEALGLFHHGSTGARPWQAAASRGNFHSLRGGSSQDDVRRRSTASLVATCATPNASLGSAGRTDFFGTSKNQLRITDWTHLRNRCCF